MEVVVEKKLSIFPDRLFADFLAKNMLYQCSTNIVITFFLHYYTLKHSQYLTPQQINICIYISKIISLKSLFKSTFFILIKF